MAEEYDKMAQHLQEALLEGYSEKFKNEFLNPKNIGELEHADSHVRITGPCGVRITGPCGDTIGMWLTIKDGKISDIRFMTDGCGATITCASYVTGAAKGKTIEPEDVVEYFEGLPDEHKHCAKLAVMTLTAAVEKYQSEAGE